MTDKHLQPKPDAVFFLQAFVAQIVEVAGQLGRAPCDRADDNANYIDIIGRATSGCLEDATRKQLGFTGEINADQYAELIVGLKNRIGGNFSRASSEPGEIRVVNTCCPFGDAVKHAPELCRMTASVFGGIAARNFGYTKVDLRKRIATNDGMCEVCIYMDPETAEDRPGDEYFSDGGRTPADTASAALVGRLEDNMRNTWCSGRAPRGGAFGPSLVAESRQMKEALSAVEIVAPSPATVLIAGETGVGKEVIARAVHALSERGTRELVSVNCGSIPENLIESTLFGHEKGAFTGAYEVHHGLFERADKGTLFLDEVDSMPSSAQARLLRVLQEGEYERVGGKRKLRADVRIIAAARPDIGEMVERDEFRRDLYYRLNVVPIYIPPLRERKDDILALAERYIGYLADKYRRPAKVLGDRARFQALTYKWPGNVRELENLIERVFLFTHGKVIEDLGIKPTTPDDNDDVLSPTLRKVKRDAAMQAESGIMVDALVTHRGNVSAVARVMGITPRAVHMKLKAHGLKAEDFRDHSKH